MNKELDTGNEKILSEQAAHLRTEAQLTEKDQLIAQLIQQNAELQSKMNALDSLKRDLHYVQEIVNNVQDIVFISDHQGIFRFINPAAEKLLGFPLSEMLGKHFTSLIREDYAEVIRNTYRDQIRDRVASSYIEFPVKNAFHLDMWLGQRVSFVYQEDKLYEAHSISRDVSEQVHARKQLSTTYSRLKGLVENLHAGVLVEDENRKIVLVNQQFCDFFSIPVSPSSMIGADCVQAAEQSKHLFLDPEAFVQGVDLLLKNRRLTLAEDLYMADGKILERHYIPVYHEAEYLGHMWHYQDITVKRTAGERLRKSEEKYRGIMENMELGLLEVSSDAKIVRAYPRFCEMVGYTEEEIIGKDPIKLFSPLGFSEKARQEEDRFIKGKSVIWEAPLLKKNGAIVWTLINNTPIYNNLGVLVGTLGIHLDITEQKLLQADLERARQEAEQARDAEKAFLANMSHEIRNPINSIVGMTNLLYDTHLSKEQLEYVNTLKYSSELLHSLVSDVLDISKIDQGKMDPQLEDFEFVEMMRALCRTFEFRLAQRDVKFIFKIDASIPSRLRSDPTFIHQILLNLLSNAFKFTEHGQILFSIVSVLDDGKKRLKFTLKDSGMGIEADRLPFIFERFNQAGKANKPHQDGTGLGLPITKQLVELLGGTITVSSQPATGTTFEVLLPYELAKEQDPISFVSKQPKISVNAEQLKVLIVEDNPMNRRYLENLLLKWGLSYTSAEDGQIALNILENKRFDLILMDIRMPNLDGYETTLRLRNAGHNPNQNVPIIALTASALLDEKEKALQAGMNHHLSKPFTPEQLQGAFQNFFPQFANYQAPSSAAPSLNRNELAELYENDTSYMREIFQIFVQTTPVELAQMRELLEKEQWKDFAAKAHKIKPSFQMVGLGYLGARAELLQRAKADFNPVDLVRDFAIFEEAAYLGIKLVESEILTMG
jgi:PAS domain S-box-containing protein